MPVQMSDRQWERIKRASGLPERARRAIEIDASGYLSMLNGPDTFNSEVTRNHLKRLHTRILRVRDGLRDFLESDAGYFALVEVQPNEWYPRSLDQRRRLSGHGRTEDAINHLDELAEWLQGAVEKIGKRHPGPSSDRAETIYLFVEALSNTIEEFRGKRITRSLADQKLIQEICQIIDPGIGSGTIETALRRLTQRI